MDFSTNNTWQQTADVRKSEATRQNTGRTACHIQNTPHRIEQIIIQHAAQGMNTQNGRHSGGLSGTTRLLTRDKGLLAISKLATERVAVLDANGGWMEGEIHLCGLQDLLSVSFGIGYNQRNHITINAVADHVWTLRDGRKVHTDTLRKGDEVAVGTPIKTIADQETYRRGVVHGVVFGDGTQGKTNYSIRLCGEKNAPLANFFTQEGWTRSRPPSSGGDMHLQISKSKAWSNLKGHPTEWSLDYLRGFFRGWFSADGSVAQKGGYAILSCDAAHLPFIEVWGPVVGFGVRHVARLSSTTNYGTRKTETINAILTNWTMDATDFLLACHQHAFKRVEGVWKVRTVQPQGYEPVYNLSTTTGCAFILESGIAIGGNRP